MLLAGISIASGKFTINKVQPLVDNQRDFLGQGVLVAALEEIAQDSIEVNFLQGIQLLLSADLGEQADHQKEPFLHRLGQRLKVLLAIRSFVTCLHY